MTDRILNPVVWLAAFALAIFGFIQAERAVQKAYREVRYQFARAFRRGRIPADGGPLSAEHEEIWTRTLRNYGQRGQEPAHQQRQGEGR